MHLLIGPEDAQRVAEAGMGLAPRLDYRLVADLCDAAVVEGLPAPSGFSGPKPTRILRSLLLNLAWSVRTVSRAPKASIIYSTGETWGLPAALALKLLRKSCIHIVYAHRVYSPAWLQLLRVLRGAIQVDGWLCVTRHQAELLRSMLGSSGTPVAVVSQGVDTDFFDPIKASSKTGPPYVLSVGAEMRDYDLLFEAVRGLPLNLVVKASSAWMIGGRQQLTVVPENVKVVTERIPYVELRDLYAGAALVVTSLLETPQAAGITTILEGMAMGKCIVATQSSGLPDALVDGVTGLISPPSVSGLRHTVESIWQDRNRRMDLALAGQKHVRSHYTLEHHATAVTAFMSAAANHQDQTNTRQRHLGPCQ